MVVRRIVCLGLLGCFSVFNTLSPISGASDILVYFSQVVHLYTSIITYLLHATGFMSIGLSRHIWTELTFECCVWGASYRQRKSCKRSRRFSLSNQAKPRVRLQRMQRGGIERPNFLLTLFGSEMRLERILDVKSQVLMGLFLGFVYNDYPSREMCTNRQLEFAVGASLP